MSNPTQRTPGGPDEAEALPDYQSNWPKLAKQTSVEQIAMMQHAVRADPRRVASPLGLLRIFPGLRK
jgi:hypothetical protein